MDTRALVARYVGRRVVATNTGTDMAVSGEVISIYDADPSDSNEGQIYRIDDRDNQIQYLLTSNHWVVETEIRLV